MLQIDLPLSVPSWFVQPLSKTIPSFIKIGNALRCLLDGCGHVIISRIDGLQKRVAETVI
jgi:hypothetical protein